MINRITIIILLAILLPHTARAERNVTYETSDSVQIMKLLSDRSFRSANIPGRLEIFARSVEGLPYITGPLEEQPERLIVNMRGFDCVTLVETFAALNKAAGLSNPAWSDFTESLRSFRYRKGETDGYASRLHYTSDWIEDNAYRGNLKDITDEIETPLRLIRSLDYMSTHRDAYPAMKDSATFARIRSIEEGYRNFRIPYLKKEVIGKKSTAGQLRSGDIIVFITKTPGLDASHVGLIVMVDGEPHLLHASSSQGKVTLEEKPISEYFRRSARNSPGFRILRLTE